MASSAASRQSSRQHEGLGAQFRPSLDRRRRGPGDAAGEQPIEDGGILGIPEILRDLFRHHRPDILHALNLLLRGMAQRPDIAKVLRQAKRCGLAHVADPEGI